MESSGQGWWELESSNVWKPLSLRKMVKPCLAYSALNADLKRGWAGLALPLGRMKQVLQAAVSECHKRAAHHKVCNLLYFYAQREVLAGFPVSGAKAT